MSKFHKRYRSLIFVGLLAACSPGELSPTGSQLADEFRGLIGDWNVEEVSNLPRPSGAYEAALFDEFVRLGAAERAEADWNDTTFFLNRARRLSRGERVNPSPLETRRLPEDSIAEFTDARRRLMIALTSQRVWKQPVEAAGAQASYECWLQEREENFQDQDISACRTTFLA